MLLFKQIFIFILLKLIPIIFSTETVKTVGSNIDCSCPSEETFDSNLKEGVFKSPGCEYWNNYFKNQNSDLNSILYFYVSPGRILWFT